MDLYERMEVRALVKLACAMRIDQCAVIPVEPPVLVNGPHKLAVCEQAF
jgi:hypothetical protein